ncbi:MAG: sigma-E factor negative regulatory protein [Marinobacter sp.]|uniref:sigma-E factor negative regulatory protein n=1 Tax=Marinobacter sp. TaxID=50741 RepID=UPI00299F4778|nr:sigma-E factor negative regulatory protein [Marinobacter sp.]MDX1634043.1 sigma-E factor negative regulatory protein [Marinobacter sp.]
MDERLKETLSAMMDDQADELSVRRLFSHPDQQEVRAQWQRWQQVRDLMHEPGLEPVDVSAGVRDTLAGRPVAAAATASAAAAGRRLPVWRWPIAAMVVMALVVGFGAGAGWDDDGTGQVPLVRTGTGVDTGAAAIPEVALQGLNQDQWEHLSRYLLEHAQHSSLGAGPGSVSYARLTSVSGPAGPDY